MTKELKKNELHFAIEKLEELEGAKDGLKDQERQKSLELEELYLDPKVEAQLVRKLDVNAMPIICVMYFLAALDRSNIGNAGAAGLVEDLNLTSSQFSNAVSLFFVTYIVLELPASLLLRILKPSRLLSFFVFSWAMVCVGTTFVQSYGSLLACRLLLGASEACFFPCLVIYISLLYKQSEQGLRLAVLLSFSALLGAFGGLISYGFIHVQTPALEGYRFIFLVEGLITVVAVPWLLFWLPDEPTNAKFLNQEEQEVMAIRTKLRERYMGSDQFEWKELRVAFTEIKTYYSMVIQFCQDLILFGFLNFLPSILKSGLHFGTLKAQYLTIPVYVVSSIAVISVSYYSDRHNLRGPFIFVYNLLGIIGYILLLACSNNGVKYFATFLIAFPLYTGPGLNLAWTSSNSFPHYRRTTAVGSNQTFGNVSGAIAGQVYRKSPYVLGHAFSLGCLIVANICVCLNSLHLKRLNREKELILSGLKEDTQQERTGNQALDFVYTF